MEGRFRFVKRGVALVTALALTLSGINFKRTSLASAEEAVPTVGSGALIANTYDKLSDAEKALLASGLLAEETYSFTAPSGSSLVGVDTDSKTVTVQPYMDSGYTWQAVSAVLYNGQDEKIEDVALSGGVGTYTHTGEDFSVKVTYEMTVPVDTETQTAMLDTVGGFYTGRKNADRVYGTDAALSVIVTAMDALESLANGMQLNLYGYTVLVSMGAEGKAAVKALAAQMKANGGLLNLQAMNAAYAADRNGYLLKSGAEYEAEAASTLEHISAIAGDPVMDNELVDSNIGKIKPEYDKAWKALKAQLSSLVKDLSAVAEPWNQPGVEDVRPELTAQQQAQLGTLVEDLLKQETVTAAADLELTGTLVADRTVVTASANAVEVAFKAVLQHYDDTNTLTELTKTQRVKVALDASRDEIADAAAASVGAQIGEALAQMGLDITGYSLTVDTNTGDGLADLTDAYYTVTYIPKTFRVEADFGELTGTYGYGSKLSLEKYPDSTKVYDYSVNGKNCEQGTAYTVTGDTVITRTTGKPYVTTDLFSILAAAFGSEKETAILTSGALLNNTSLRVRFPDNDEGTLIVPGDGTLTFGNRPSGYEGLEWVPYSYEVLGKTYPIEGEKTVTIDAPGAETVTVNYRLELTGWTQAEAQAVLDTVKEMADQAAGQKAALDQLNSQYSSMGQITKGILNMLKSVIEDTELHEDPDTNFELQEHLIWVIGGIVDDCFDVNGQLKIYNMLTEYRKTESGGLIYYYRNSEEFIEEIGLLSEYLSEMLRDDETIAAVQTLMASFGYAQYADRFVELEGIMANVSESLTPAHEAIDMDSRNLDVLVKALTMEGAVGSKATSSPYLEESFLVDAPNKAGVLIQIVVGTKVLDTVTENYELSDKHVLTQADIDGIKEKLAAAVPEYLKSKYYSESFDTELDSLVGRVMDGSVVIRNVFTPVPYTVKIRDTEDQTIDAESLAVSLPTPPIGFRYDYTIDGKTVNAESYRFTLEQLDRLFVDNTYTIELTKVNIAVERLLKFMDQLNAAGGSVMRFSLNEDQDTITLDMATANKSALSGALQRVFLAMLNGYGYIGVGGEGMLYTTESGGMQISLQPIINAVLKDKDFSSQTLIDLRDGEGHLTGTRLQLGDSLETLEQDIAFEINLTSVSSQLIAVGNALAQMKNNMVFSAGEGVLQIDTTLPEEAYKSLLTALLYTDGADRTDLNGATSGAASRFLYIYAVQAAKNEQVTMQTYENTLSMLGWNYDLAGDQEYYEYISEILRNSTATYTDEGSRIQTGMEIKTMLDEAADNAGVGAVIKLIKEYETGLSLPILLTTKIYDGYEALVLDREETDMTLVHSYPASLSEALGQTTSGTLQILLQKDIEGDLVIPGNSVLDLNGYSVNGSVTALGTLCIMDGSGNTLGCGSVTGQLEGDITVLSGSYTADVSGLIPEGFVQEDGLVRNVLYTVSTAEDGTITYTVNGDLNTDTLSQAAIDAIARVLEAERNLLHWPYAAMSQEGKTFYQRELPDLLGRMNTNIADVNLDWARVEGLDAQSVADMIAAILKDQSNYAAIAAGESVGTYVMQAAPWFMEMEYIAEGDYINFHMKADPETRERKVAVVIAGEQTKDLAQQLDTIVTGTETQVTLEKTILARGSMILSGTAAKTVTLDMTQDSRYVTVLAVVLAYGNEDLRPAVAQAVNKGQQQKIRAAVETATLAQLIDALKALDAAVDFAAMASAVGVTADVTEAAELAQGYLKHLDRLDAVLAKLTVSEGGRTLASFATEDGYALTGLTLSRELHYDTGSTTLALAMPTELTLNIALYGQRAIDVLDAEGNSVLSTDELSEAMAALATGYTLQLNQQVAQDKTYEIACGIKITGASNLDRKGFCFLLANGGAIQSDGALTVGSAVKGHVAVCAAGSFTYTLRSIAAPTFDATVADVRVLEHGGVTYLALDIHPKSGKTLDELMKSLTFGDLQGELSYTVSGNDGSGRIKTGSELKLTLKDGDLILAEVSYTLVVAGDVNKDGLVTAGDAVAMTNIYNGNTAAFAHCQILAADTNCNGTAASPKVEAGDAVRIMTKYLNWESYLSLMSK